MAIKEFLQSVWRSVEAAGESIASDAEKIVVDFATNALHQIEQNGGPILVDAAMRAVIQAEAAGGSSEDKFLVAVRSVENALVTKGLPVVQNAIRLAVETAVANLQDNQGLLPLVTKIAVDASTPKTVQQVRPGAPKPNTLGSTSNGPGSGNVGGAGSAGGPTGATGPLSDIGGKGGRS